MRGTRVAMSATTSHLAHHFDDADQQFDAASLGMWVFLATEVLFFGGMFAGYILYRYWYPDAFIAGSRRLDEWLGTINTAVLLTSSLMMALAVNSAQTDDRRGTIRFLTLTIALGTIFLGIKGFEYYHKFTEHLVPGSSFSLSAGTCARLTSAGRSRFADRRSTRQPPARSTFLLILFRAHWIACHTHDHRDCHSRAVDLQVKAR